VTCSSRSPGGARAHRRRRAWDSRPAGWSSNASLLSCASFLSHATPRLSHPPTPSPRTLPRGNGFLHCPMSAVSLKTAGRFVYRTTTRLCSRVLVGSSKSGAVVRSSPSPFSQSLAPGHSGWASPDRRAPRKCSARNSRWTSAMHSHGWHPPDQSIMDRGSRPMTTVRQHRLARRPGRGRRGGFSVTAQEQVERRRTRCPGAGAVNQQATLGVEPLRGVAGRLRSEGVRFAWRARFAASASSC
jgi:hypothetical protein